MRHILTSRSTENLPMLAMKCDVSLSSPKCSKRGTRRSMRSRAQSHSPEAYLDNNSRETEMLKEKEQQLKINLDKISQQQRYVHTYYLFTC